MQDDQVTSCDVMKTGGFSAVTPVDDIYDSSHAYDKQECALRRKLATLYRLVHHLGWSQAIYNHITVRPSYYRKRGSASYIVREVLLVRERERERERERDTERERRK